MADRRKQCKAIAEHPHIKCTHTVTGSFSVEFRVTLDGISKSREEAVAYYTDDYQDAFDTAADMSRRRVTEIAGLHDNRCAVVLHAAPCDCAMAALTRR